MKTRNYKKIMEYINLSIRILMKEKNKNNYS